MMYRGYLSFDDDLLQLNCRIASCKIRGKFFYPFPYRFAMLIEIYVIARETGEGEIKLRGSNVILGYLKIVLTLTSGEEHLCFTFFENVIE